MPSFLLGDRGEELFDQGRGGQRIQVWTQLCLELRVVDERPVLGAILDIKVEWIDHCHVGHEIDRDDEAVGLLGQHDAGAVVGEGVLLPIDEMQLGLEVERVAEDRGAAVRGRPQPDHLRCHSDHAVIVVGRPVRESDVECHQNPFSKSTLVQRSATIEHLLPRTKFRHCLASGRAATSLGNNQERKQGSAPGPASLQERKERGVR